MPLRTRPVRTIVGFNDTFAGLRLSSYHFGTT
jgi:hypothetical protein